MPKPTKLEPFPRVALAREVLKERATEIIEAYLALAAKASEAGKEDVAADILWKLIDHMPRDGGSGIIDSSKSKPPTGSTGGSALPTGPTINIGLALGGMAKEPKTLPAPKVEIIDVETQD